jgi:hypothetical protein
MDIDFTESREARRLKKPDEADYILFTIRATKVL